MGNTAWQRQRKAAEEAGALYAQGGPDRRAHFAAMGTDVGMAYQSGFDREREEMERRHEYEQHPLRQISREANSLFDRCESREAAEVAQLVEQLADYLLEREDDGK